MLELDGQDASIKQKDTELYQFDKLFQTKKERKVKVFFGIIKVYRSKIGKLGEIHPTFLRFQLLGPLCTFMISYLTRKTRQIDVMSTKKPL